MLYHKVELQNKFVEFMGIKTDSFSFAPKLTCWVAHKGSVDYIKYFKNIYGDDFKYVEN